jgi:LPS sulfotransferase NodH
MSTGSDKHHRGDFEGVYDLASVSTDYPGPGGPPKRSIVVCTTMRSGSTLLGEAMYFAGGLGCPLEYYHPGFRPAFESRWAAHDIHVYTTALHQWRTDPGGTFSAKLFWPDAIDLVKEMAPALYDSLPSAGASQWRDEHYRTIWSAISPLFPNPVFVRLLRRDEVGQAVSYCIAAKTGRFRRFTEAASRRAPEYCFDTIVQQLALIQNANVHWRRFFSANVLTCRTILYEDLSENYQSAVGNLLADLGATAPFAPKPRLQRQADNNSELFRRRFIREFQERAGRGR